MIWTLAALDRLVEEIREHSAKPEPEPQSDYDWWHSLDAVSAYPDKLAINSRYGKGNWCRRCGHDSDYHPLGQPCSFPDCLCKGFRFHR